jgi:hypothetical protein
MKFDVILLINVLHFVKHELHGEFIRKIKALLNKEGILVLVFKSFKECMSDGTFEGMINLAPKIYKQKSSLNPKTYYLLDENDQQNILGEFDFVEEFNNEKWGKNERKFICRT